MKFYLSSYKIGNQAEQLQHFFSANTKVGYIPNALDFSAADPESIKEHMEADMVSLAEIGLEVEALDLRQYFGKKDALVEKINILGGVWVSGGNVFVLRQAMKLSGFDDILLQLNEKNDFVYGGYSAAGCVLSKKLDAYAIVDDANDFPYFEIQETIWEGIGLIDFVLLPHFDSDHPESSDINKELQYCMEHQLSYKTLRDGDVLIMS